MAKVEVDVQADVDELLELITKVKDLEDSEELFKKLSGIQTVKDALGRAQDIVTSAEGQVKTAINDKAKSLYGNQWQVIAGNGYKITRSMTGSVYDIADIEAIDDKLTTTKTTVNTKAVEKAIQETGKLPEGVELNPKRGESIQIKVGIDED